MYPLVSVFGLTRWDEASGGCLFVAIQFLFAVVRFAVEVVIAFNGITNRQGRFVEQLVVSD
jgi:hypothetical protein